MELTRRYVRKLQACKMSRPAHPQRPSLWRRILGEATMMYQKLSSPFAAIALAVLLIAGAGPVLAQGISGAFLFNGTNSCVEVVAPATFDSAFRPTAGPVSLSNANYMGYRVFNADGTGYSVTLMGVNTFVPVPPGTFTVGASSASSWEVQHQFTYTVAPGTKIITITLTPNTYLQTILSGPRAGQTVTQDVLSSYGYMTADGKSLTTISKGTEVETRTFSNGDVRRHVCSRTASGPRL